MFNKNVLTRMTIAAAVSGLALTTALAQTTAPAPAEKMDKAPVTTTTPKATAPSATPNSNAATNAQANAAPMIVSQQSPDQWLASKFNGTDVIGVDGKKIGDVDDVLFEKDGKVSAYVIGVGGVLGIGAKQIALDPSSVEVIPGKNGNSDAQLKVAMNKDELSKAAEFKPYTPPRPAAAPPAGTPARPLKTN